MNQFEHGGGWLDQFEPGGSWLDQFEPAVTNWINLNMAVADWINFNLPVADLHFNLYFKNKKKYLVFNEWRLSESRGSSGCLNQVVCRSVWIPGASSLKWTRPPWFWGPHGCLSILIVCPPHPIQMPGVSAWSPHSSARDWFDLIGDISDYFTALELTNDKV